MAGGSNLTAPSERPVMVLLPLCSTADNNNVDGAAVATITTTSMTMMMVLIRTKGSNCKWR